MEENRNFKLKSAPELRELIETSGVKDINKMKDIVDYIDKLHKQLLNYQSSMGYCFHYGRKSEC